ncbi:cation-binding protein [candidate division WOR-3 bacterium]|uniref:Cation-binding protein n=1 Tax=candidate division WOR-3 bacterium TaxID=2052148 RepID=A0A937XIZ7_UNCW3|nr:cation-binding protein [candidate division WOR-3 bacterium]
MSGLSPPTEALAAEHRLTERMLAVMEWRVAEMESVGTADVAFIDGAVEFLRTYAGRCHHGKEEDILFRELARKPLTAEHRRLLEELTAEHVFSRTTTAQLVEARTRHAAGQASALAEVISCLHLFVEFYPKHIAKEEQEFFPSVLNYFTAAELSWLRAEQNEFDRRLVHTLYEKAVAAWELMPSQDSDSGAVAGGGSLPEPPMALH